MTSVLKIANQSFYMTLAHNDAWPYQVWLQKDSALEKTSSRTFAEILTFPVTLTLITTEQPNIFTRQSTSWWCAIKQSLIAKGSTGSEVILESHIFDYMILCCDLALEDSQPTCLEVSKLVSQLVSQSTTKGYIRAEGDFHKEVYSWKDQYGKNKTFGGQSGSWWCITISSLRVKRSVIQMILSVILTLNTAIKFLHRTLRLMIMNYQTKFGSKRISISEDNNINNNNGYFQMPILRSSKPFTRPWKGRGDRVTKMITQMFVSDSV